MSVGREFDCVGGDGVAGKGACTFLRYINDLYYLFTTSKKKENSKSEISAVAIVSRRTKS